MNKFAKYTLIAIASNILFSVLILIPAFTCQNGNCLGLVIIGFLLIGLSLLIQFIVGLFFLNSERKKVVGQALLLSAGIFLLIGSSLCSMK